MDRDYFSQPSNNYQNFEYGEKNKFIFKSKKISKNKLNHYFLYSSDNLIVSDKMGNVLVYSVKENKLISKFNFYKKKYKNLEKNLSYIIEKNIIYISDNIGYLYAIDYKR